MHKINFRKNIDKYVQKFYDTSQLPRIHHLRSRESKESTESTEDTGENQDPRGGGRDEKAYGNGTGRSDGSNNDSLQRSGGCSGRRLQQQIPVQRAAQGRN